MPKKNAPTYPNESFTPLSTEYDQTHTVNLEEFPEGPYGAAINLDISKDEWKEGMHSAPVQAYEARGFHEGIPRQDPAAHDTHDDPNTNEQDPYNLTHAPK
ncbi:hypothetical protein [Aneurinibacillus tyrosinisolvens]|uniref:hypothetical protein n=1 Tax=Aneurinibacillus tyrosinisolvens TaxID=1443435 RepID=UPI00069BCB1C|nr:hypothetical protein [Aneurinibacillus tyrosinisolvens]